MANTNRSIFIFLKIIAWIIFTGLCIEACALLVNFIVSIYNPSIISKLYLKLDLSALYQQSKWLFYNIYSILIAIATLKAILFYLVIKLTDNINLNKPFTTQVIVLIKRISYLCLSVGIINIIGQSTVKNLIARGFPIASVRSLWSDSEAYILMAAIIYIMACIFKKGYELQYENDLTV